MMKQMGSLTVRANRADAEIEKLKGEMNVRRARPTPAQAVPPAQVSTPRSAPAAAASVNMHRVDAEIVECELVVREFGAPLTHDSIVLAYKDWATTHMPERSPLPKFKSRRIDESAKLVLETIAQAKTVLDAHDVAVIAGEGVSFRGQNSKMKPSRPFRQRRLSDHMGGVKYKISNVGTEHPLSGLNLEQDKCQWEAAFERGCVSGGKLFYDVSGRPQIVAKLSLDACQCSRSFIQYRQLPGVSF